MNREISYGRQSIDDDDIAAVVAALKSTHLTQGPKVTEFESALANFCGAKYAVVMNSGTAALHAAYHTARLKEGDEIITTPITFAATANAALMLGAKPVFVDVEPDTGNMSMDRIESAITAKTRLIVPVHYAGHPVDVDVLHKIADKHNITIVEDACHAIGAEYKGRRIGSNSEMSVFSFHPVKHITTGEGGAVLTDNSRYAETMRSFRSHGMVYIEDAQRDIGAWHYAMTKLGWNHRMTDFQAALGVSQLKKLPSFVARRREIAAKYRELFCGYEHIEMPPERDYAVSSWHLFPVKLSPTTAKKKREIFAKLRSRNMIVQVHYIPVYTHPYYVDLGYKKGICPNAESFYERELSIPMFPAMTDDDVEYSANLIKETISEFV